MAEARKRQAVVESYEKLVALSETDLVEGSEPCPCGLCFKMCPCPVLLKNCIHSFCRECLTAWITCSDNDWGQCPYRDEQYTCQSFLEEKEIRALVSADDYNRLIEKSLEGAKAADDGLHHCMIPGCGGQTRIAAGANSFICPECHSSNCTTCMVVHPEGKCPPLESLQSEQVVVKKRRTGDYKKLLTLDKNKLVLSREMVECPICLCETEPKKAIVLKECLHTFCRACLVQCISQCDGGPVRCPYMDSNYSCQSFLQDREVQGLGRKRIYERYLEKSILLAETKMKNSFHCKMVDCSGWCEFEQGVSLFQCPICQHKNCLDCNAIHEGMDCKEFKKNVITAKLSEDKIEAMVKKGDAMKCPGCKAVIMKDYGCDAVICSFCRLLICWVTKQARWGPKGPGDTSAGCRCQVNGIVCHPKCRNCH